MILDFEITDIKGKVFSFSFIGGGEPVSEEL